MQCEFLERLNCYPLLTAQFVCKHFLFKSGINKVEHCRLCLAGSSCNHTGNRGHWVQHSSKGQGEYRVLNELHPRVIGLGSHTHCTAELVDLNCTDSCRVFITHTDLIVCSILYTYTHVQYTCTVCTCMFTSYITIIQCTMHIVMNCSNSCTCVLT